MQNEKKIIDWKTLLPRPKIDYKFEENHIILIVPRTENRIMKAFLKYLRQENIRYLHLDELGSFVWKTMEDNKTIGDIINFTLDQFPDETQLERRILLFFQQLYKEGYIELYAPSDS